MYATTWMQQLVLVEPSIRNSACATGRSVENAVQSILYMMPALCRSGNFAKEHCVGGMSIEIRREYIPYLNSSVEELVYDQSQSCSWKNVAPLDRVGAVEGPESLMSTSPS
jgi:hypothetical protein